VATAVALKSASSKNQLKFTFIFYQHAQEASDATPHTHVISFLIQMPFFNSWRQLGKQEDDSKVFAEFPSQHFIALQ